MSALSPYTYGPGYVPAYRDTYPNALNVLTAPLHTDLVSLATVKAILEITDTSKDALLALIISDVSQAICTFCSRPFGMGYYQEIYDVDMAQQLVATNNPVPTNGLVSITGYWGTPPAALTPTTIPDQIDWGAGIFTADIGFTVGRNIILYYGGWWLPGDDVVAATDISVDAATSTFTSASGAFPLLFTGATFRISGAAQSANNGLFTVDTATAHAIVVQLATLTNETAGAAISLTVRNLPKDVEMACVMQVRADYDALDINPNVESEAVPNVYSVKYSQPGVGQNAGQLLAPVVCARLRKYVRQV